MILCIMIFLAGVSVAWAEAPVAPQGLFKPTFLLPNDSWSAGTAFLVRTPEQSEPVMITCHHLFGPAAGLREQLSSDQIAAQVCGAVGLSMQDGKTIVVATTYLPIQNAGVFNQAGAAKDLAPFVVSNAQKLKVFEFAEKMPSKGDVVYLFARLRGEAEPKLFRAVVSKVDWTGVAYVFNEKSLDLRGSSGAPLINEEGKVVAMNLGSGGENAQLSGVGSSAGAIRKEIKAAGKP
jgi:hypothetical protein